MTNEQRMAFLMHLESLIFASKLAGTDITQVQIDPRWAPFIASGGRGRWFGNGLRGFDVGLRLGNVIRNFRVLEQNPMKRDKNQNFSQYAVLAQQGHRIVWIIDQAKQTDAFLGRIHDGQFIASTPRATYSAPPAQQFTGAAAGAGFMPNYTAPQGAVSTNDLPEVPVDMDIPEYVLATLENDIDPAILADLESDVLTEDIDNDLTFDPDLG
jgi:hypothetical protein